MVREFEFIMQRKLYQAIIQLSVFFVNEEKMPQSSTRHRPPNIECSVLQSPLRTAKRLILFNKQSINSLK